MSSKVFQTLRERAEILIPLEDRKNYPLFHKDLKSLEDRTTQLTTSLKTTPERQAEAHYFLNSSGINTTRLSTPNNYDNFFQEVEIQHNTDLKKFLQEEHEMILIDIIEEQRKVNYEDFESFYEKQYADYTSAIDTERMEEEINANDYREFEQYNNSMGIRINDYANVITQLNEQRLSDMDFNLIDPLSKQRNMSELQKFQDSATEAWNIVDHLVHHTVTDQTDEEQRLEGRYVKSYIAKDSQSAEAVRVRRQLIQSSKKWLEEDYMRSLNEYLNRNAAKIQIGGIPCYSYRLWAYIEHVYKSSSSPGWINKHLELKEGKPVWVFIYHLLRSGQYELAMKYVNHNRELFTTERDFPLYFSEFMTSDDHCVSRTTKENILADYIQLENGGERTDPYKKLIYKIMGRCELLIKSSTDIIKTTEDYIWLQMMLIREVTDIEPNEAERYRLSDFQDQITQNSREYGSEGANPWIYFKILLLTLQFEKSIDFLYKHKHLRLEAVHFAIALYYYGLIRIPPQIIYIQNDLKNALQYLLLLSVYSPQHGYFDDSMIQTAKHYIYKFVMTKGKFRVLLGDIDDTQRSPGLIELQAKLLHINTAKEYADQILHPIAELCVKTGRCFDAVYICSLSGDFKKMVDVLIKKLSDALQQPQFYRTADPSLSTASNEETIKFATETLTYHENLEAFVSTIDNQRRHTISKLIQLLRFRDFYEKELYEPAMHVLEEADVIPLVNNFEKIQMLVNQFNTLDSSIRKTVPELLLNAMDILYKTWSAHLLIKSVPVSQIDSLEKKARAVLTFAGMIQFHIPKDIIIRLNRVDMLMETKRKSI
ncbi:Nup93/Nic96-domain-containing protein [Mycotypha africana]|uniref:Nup93/Nic96-domain-containing protein n=1 Tax=Mycotypha africana TaxID=64632 RepID=UPI0022FFC746|nr:Nup93/Nic96-domain-containing protein [Mycotypha africana]KAI8970095.1 Nup93/Nic96-domain-containing protein [Mycotypha africana]